MLFLVFRKIIKFLPCSLYLKRFNVLNQNIFYRFGYPLETHKAFLSVMSHDIHHQTIFPLTYDI